MSKPGKNANPGPLGRVKIIDLTRAIAGPSCTMLLADMGAEVIKVEEPGRGDFSRYFAPIDGDIGEGFAVINRNKKSITLNLLNDKGKEILRKLLQQADVLTENYRPGFMQDIGFDYPAVREINPRIIMVSISAFGQTGPYAQRPGDDPVGQAMGGAMRSTSGPDGIPQTLGVALASQGASLFGAFGTLLALYNRELTGLGQYIDVSLMESVVHFMGRSLLSFAHGQNTGEWRPRGPTSSFRTKDSRYIVIEANPDNQWPIMAGILGQPEKATAAGYRTMAERTRHGREIRQAIEAWAGSKTIDEIETILKESNLSFGRVQTLADLLEDPGLKARGLIKEVNYNGETLPLFGPYPMLSDTPGSIRMSSPHLGQHNKEIYGQLLGLSTAELAVLKREGVI